MAKYLTRLTPEGAASATGSVLQVGDTNGSFTKYTADDLYPAEYSSTGNRVTLKRRRDGAAVLSSVLFSEILNSNTGQLFASSSELQQYLLSFQVGDSEPGDNNDQPSLVELDTDFWDFYEAPNAYIALSKDENLKTLNDEVPGFVAVLEAEQMGRGGFTLSINGKDIPVDKMGSTFVAARVKKKGDVAFVSGAEIADNKPTVLVGPESKTTVVNDSAELLVVGDYDRLELLFKKEIISTTPANTIVVGPDTVGGYTYRLYKGDKIEDATAFIRQAEAEPLTINSQPQNATVDVGSSYTFLPDYSSVPPAKITLYEVDGSANKKIADVPASGYAGVISDTKTYRYGAVYQLPGEPAEAPLFSETFTVEANKLVQGPPTNPVNDDANNTFSWTDASGKTFADMEYSILNAAFADVPAKPLPVGDRDLAVGDVRVRYKQTATHNASAVLSNAVAFNTSVQPTDYTLTSNQVNLVQTGKNITVTPAQQSAGGWPGSDYIGNKSLKVGDPGWLQIKIGTKFGVLSWDTAAANKNPDDCLLRLAEYDNVGVSAVLQMGSNALSIPLTNDVPHARVLKATDGTITCQRLNADGSVFDTLNTSGFAKITQPVFVGVHVAGVNDQNVLVEPRYFGITNV